MSEALLLHVVYPIILDSGVLDQATGKPVADLVIDDTTVARCGKHVAHAGWFKDASTSSSSHKGTVIHWAHNWLVGAVTLRLPGWPMRFAQQKNKRRELARFHHYKRHNLLAPLRVNNENKIGQYKYTVGTNMLVPRHYTIIQYAFPLGGQAISQVFTGLTKLFADTYR